MTIVDDRSAVGEQAVVGTRVPNPSSMARCTGSAVYTDDMTLPRMLKGRILRSRYGHAKILSIDTSKAEELPGVFKVLTGADFPVTFGILPVDQDEPVLAVEKVRYVGEPVAAIAAVDAETAERAANLIEVEYEPLDEVTSIEAGLDPSLEAIRGESNLHRKVGLDFGDVEAGFAKADHIRDDIYFFEGNTHAALETQSALAFADPGGRLTVWTSTQVPHYLHRQMASVLEIPAGRIRIVAPNVGGGFGGKTDLFAHEFCAARLAMETGRPVKITLTREEVFYAHRGRHPVLMRVKTGFASDGRITAMHFQSLLDGGAYGSYGTASTYYTGALQTTTYRIPAYRFQAVRVSTNKPPCGPKRGHGTPQPRFAIEAQLDRAAEDLGLDPVQIRRVNMVEPFSKTINHLRITSCGLSECIDRVVEASGFLQRKGSLPENTGLGLAVGAYLSGAGLPIYWNEMPQSEVHIKVDRGGGVTVYSMALDCGQGSTAMLAVLVAEVLGLRPEDLSVITADTDLTPVDLGSYSSRVTFMAGNAAVQAAEGIREMVFEAAAEKLEVPASALLARDSRIRTVDDEGMSWDEAVKLAAARSGTLVSSGSYKPPELSGPYRGSGVGPSPAYSYSAAVAEVYTDPETGLITVNKVWIAHDIGRALNVTLSEGQVEGSVHMALGEVLMEAQVFRGALHKGPSLLDYKIPSVLEMPPVETILVETIDPEGPFGAKEVGQGPLLPVIPAVANAVHDAIGVRIDEVPITPDKVLAALKSRSKGKEARYGPSAFPDAPFPDPYPVELPEEWR